jgi:hypothetical protein
MPDFSPINYPSIANLLETPARAPHKAESVSSKDSLNTSKATELYEQLLPLKLNDLRHYASIAGITHKNKGKAATKDDVIRRIVKKRETEPVQNLLSLLHDGQLSMLGDLPAGSLIDVPKDKDGYPSFMALLSRCPVEDTPERPRKTRQTKAAAPRSVERLRVPKPAGDSSPNNLFK